MQRRVISTTLAVVMILSMILSLSAFVAAPVLQGPEVTNAGVFRGVSTAVKFDVSPPLRPISPARTEGEQAVRDSRARHRP